MGVRGSDAIGDMLFMLLGGIPMLLVAAFISSDKAATW